MHFEIDSAHLGTGEVHARAGRLRSKRDHLKGWSGYYHFVRPQERLEEELAQPAKGKGNQLPRKFRKQTPAMMAGLTDRRWTVKGLLHDPSA
jgi:hypothetical protein